MEKKAYKTLSDEEERIGQAIVDSAFRVHKQLGPGLLENVYEVCMYHALQTQGFDVTRQIRLPVIFDGISIETGLRVDLMVNRLVICELKAVEILHPVYRAQILSYLTLSKKRLGYLINFNVPLIKDGISRFVK